MDEILDKIVDVEKTHQDASEELLIRKKEFLEETRRHLEEAREKEKGLIIKKNQEAVKEAVAKVQQEKQKEIEMIDMQKDRIMKDSGLMNSLTEKIISILLEQG